MDFETPEQFQQAMARHGEAILADIPNFSNIEPVITMAPAQS